MLCLISFFSLLSLTLLHSLWQAALLWVVYFLVNRYLVNQSSQRFSLTLYFFGSQLVASVITALVLYNTSQSDAGKIFYVAADPDLLYYLTNLLGIFYLVFLGFQLKKINEHRNSLHDFLGASQMTAPPAWRLFVQKHRNLLGIKRSVKVYLSRTLQSPVTAGFLKPVILLPVSLVNGLTTAQTEAILLHELAHIKRNDYLLNIVLNTLKEIFFFNPIVQQVIKDAIRYREHCCDDVVMEFNYNKVEYSEALVYLHQAEMQPAMIAFSHGEDYELLQRIKRMVAKDESHASHPVRTGWKLVGALFISILLAATPFFLKKENKRLAGHQTERLGLYNYQKSFAFLKAVSLNKIDHYFSFGKDLSNENNGSVITIKEPAFAEHSFPQAAAAVAQAMPDLVLNMEPAAQHADVETILPVSFQPAVNEAKQAEEDRKLQEEQQALQSRQYEQQEIYGLATDRLRLSLDAKEIDEEKLIEDALKQLAEKVVYEVDDSEVLQSLIVSLVELKLKNDSDDFSRRSLGENMIEAFKRTELARDLKADHREDYNRIISYLQSLLVNRSIRL